mmetsp:Transcript_14511/g.50519  ORF Transcript_14511/g.50519 Transcript_14511/m.50519 type:complete len:221 (-) Transcript_14511:817-1479(-)
MVRLHHGAAGRLLRVPLPRAGGRRRRAARAGQRHGQLPTPHRQVLRLAARPAPARPHRRRARRLRRQHVPGGGPHPVLRDRGEQGQAVHAALHQERRRAHGRARRARVAAQAAAALAQRLLLRHAVLVAALWARAERHAAPCVAQAAVRLRASLFCRQPRRHVAHHRLALSLFQAHPHVRVLRVQPLRLALHDRPRVRRRILPVLPVPAHHGLRLRLVAR